MSSMSPINNSVMLKPSSSAAAKQQQLSSIVTNSRGSIEEDVFDSLWKTTSSTTATVYSSSPLPQPPSIHHRSSLTKSSPMPMAASATTSTLASLPAPTPTPAAYAPILRMKSPILNNNNHAGSSSTNSSPPPPSMHPIQQLQQRSSLGSISPQPQQIVPSTMHQQQQQRLSMGSVSPVPLSMQQSLGRMSPQPPHIQQQQQHGASHQRLGSTSPQPQHFNQEKQQQQQQQQLHGASQSHHLIMSSPTTPLTPQLSNNLKAVGVVGLAGGGGIQHTLLQSPPPLPEYTPRKQIHLSVSQQANPNPLMSDQLRQPPEPILQIQQQHQQPMVMNRARLNSAPAISSYEYTPSKLRGGLVNTPKSKMANNTPSKLNHIEVVRPSPLVATSPLMDEYTPSKARMSTPLAGSNTNLLPPAVMLSMPDISPLDYGNMNMPQTRLESSTTDSSLPPTTRSGNRGRLDTTETAVTMPHFNYNNQTVSRRRVEDSPQFEKQQQSTEELFDEFDGRYDEYESSRQSTVRVGNGSTTGRTQQQQHVRSNTLDFIAGYNANASDVHFSADAEPTPRATNRSPAIPTISFGRKLSASPALPLDNIKDEVRNNAVQKKLLFAEEEGVSDGSFEKMQQQQQGGAIDGADESFDDDGSVVYTYTDSRTTDVACNNENIDLLSELYDDAKVKALRENNVTELLDAVDDGRVPVQMSRSAPKDENVGHSEVVSHDDVGGGDVKEGTKSKKKKTKPIIDMVPSEQPENDEDGDGATDSGSDVSSLSDTVSFRQSNAPPTSAAAAGGISAWLTRRKSLRRVKSAKAAEAYAEVRDTVQSSKSTAERGLRRVATSRYANQYDEQRYDADGLEVNRDTVTTAANTSHAPSISHSLDTNKPELNRGTSHTLETIDHSLEQHLFRNGLHQHRPTVFVPNPLGAEIEHAKSIRSHRRVQSSLGPGSSVSSGSRGSAIPRHRRTPSHDGAYHRHVPNNPLRRTTSIESELTSGSNVDGIQASWLMSTPRVRPPRQQHPILHPSLGGHPLPEIPQPDEDLIDVSKDEPVDPFSGLIGMPSFIGCESVASGDALCDGGSYMGLHVFGTPAASTPGGNTTTPQHDGVSLDAHAMPLSNRPPTGRRSKSITLFDEFDPLLEDQELMLDSQSLHSNTPSHNAAIPPRHLRDDPLLSRSRYRSPMQQALFAQRNQTKTNKKKLGHQRSISLGGDSLGSSVLGGSVVGTNNMCLLGNIANLEANKSPMTPAELGMRRNISSTSLEYAGSVGPLGGGSSIGGLSLNLETPGSITEEGMCTENAASITSPVSIQGSSINASIKLNDIEKEDDDDASSYGSFGEEYNRSEQKRKIVATEIKHMMKPMVGLGRKLVGRRAKDGTGLKRSEGCLA